MQNQPLTQTYKYAQCLVNIAKMGTKTFTYLIGDTLASKIKIGQAVLLPFGKNRTISGWVVGFTNYLEDGIKAKEILEITEADPLFDSDYLKLLEFVSNYYFCELPTVLKCAIPEKFFEKNVKKYREPKIKNAIFEGLTVTEQNTLSPAQQKVFDEIVKINPKTALLYGITGSGKTEIYFKLIEKTIEAGKNVLFLAPEIALVTQLTMRTAEKFGSENVGIWHSSIGEAEKYKVWQNLRQNKIKILFGARSAVFAPLKNIGLIIIDESHDTSYKQTMPAPRYDSRLVARKLAELHGANVILGSATPDISDYYEAVNSNSLFVLKERYQGAELARSTVIDMRTERFEGNFGIFSKYLVQRIKETVDEGHQVILLINRRGFANYSQCMSCGEVVMCPKCAIPLIYHKQTNSHKCHFCGSEIKNLQACPTCNTEALENFGVGVERVEKIAQEIFEDCTIARFDSDILGKKNEHIEILNDFKSGKIDILIGTQMIAKGLDNKNVTLVGVINADLSFNLPDYRSTERGFSLLTQVAGRSGRGEAQGQVIFQTYNSENDYLELAKNQDYENFYDTELEVRDTLDYPPFSKIIRVILQSKNEFRAEHAAVEIVHRLNSYIDKLALSERLILLGPSPCVIEKIRGEYRFNFLIKNKLGDKGHFTILSFLKQVILPDDIKMIVDVDPSDIL